MSGAYTAIIQTGDGWLRFSGPSEILRARTHDGVDHLMEQVESALSRGRFVAGYLAYEAAPGMDPALDTRHLEDLPVAAFGVFTHAEPIAELPPARGTYSVGEWHPSVGEDAYHAAVAKIRCYLEAGDTYQVNYTMRLRASFSGNAYALFRQLSSAQRGRYAAYLEFDGFAVCSASPELFFEVDGDRVISKPMKGTAARGASAVEDDANAKALHDSEKNRAENIMIVDMVRNDFGRVAVPGTVRVPRRYEVERYPTVLQMTSTVVARTESSLSGIMRAIFPCASITGAPKVRTMQIIRELEPDPRGIYTGAIGYAAPPEAVPGAPRRARFNVAIRTVVVDISRGEAEYGVGGGIVWDSSPAAEYEECLAKAAVLTAPFPDFNLLETLAWAPQTGFRLLARHMARLARSAGHFGYSLDLAEVERRLDEAVGRSVAPQRVRLLVDPDGRIGIETTTLGTGARAPLRVALCAESVQSRDPFMYHKTTHRDVYDRARASRPDCDDVILQNERGELTEATIANVVLGVGPRKVTPAADCGLLPGTFREELLEAGEIEEAVLRAEDLDAADSLWLINSVRGWMPAALADVE